MSPEHSFDSVVIDANVLIGICTKETKEDTARNVLADYAARGFRFFAPNVVVAEFLYIVCRKLAEGAMTESQSEKALEDFADYMTVISPPLNGEASLIKRAAALRKDYGCNRSSDAIYIAIAEELCAHGQVELLTFDAGIVNQAAKTVPPVKVNLLPV